jgi:GTPase-associated protein 1, N-terminal domain type 1
MRPQFQFHQALFGYDAGHHLLASSLQLSSEVRHLLAVATDLSGSAPPTGFDGAYTGLPIQGTNYYAFFCTWSAPEIPRPGCVWGHVLLIQLEDLAELSDLGSLRSYVRRPDLKDLTGYNVPLQFQAKTSISAQGLTVETRILAERLLAALYFTQRTPVVLIVNEAEKVEDLVFALWSQQWPQLRETFRFSTGSFADRGKGGTPFDLQVSPEANRRAWQRGTDYLIVDKMAIHESVVPAEAKYWNRSAIDDLLAPDSRGFRSFLRLCAADISDPRGAFARLASAYEQLELSQNTDWIGTLSAIGEMFPGETEALTLKKHIVNLDYSPKLKPNSERSLLTASFLLASDVSKPYEGVYPEVTHLAQGLWYSRRQDVLALLAQLVRREERPAAIAFVAAIASIIQPADVKLIAEQYLELIPLFVSRRPDLACYREIWTLPTNLQWRILEVLDGLSLSPESWGDIMAAMLLAGTGVAIADTVRKAGPFAIRAAFRWLDSQTAQEYLPTQAWREALALPASDRLRASESLPPSFLALCSWLAPPDAARDLLNASRLDVQALAKTASGDLPRPLRVHVSFLMVTLGLRAGDALGARLLASGFFPVYDALATSDYSLESWLLLSPELPQLGVWGDWDRCRRLRRAVRQRLSQYLQILANALTEYATKPEHRVLIDRVCRVSS